MVLLHNPIDRIHHAADLLLDLPEKGCQRKEETQLATHAWRLFCRVFLQQSFCLG
ncbi:MAG: hypothetical protein JWO91_485 [Acidobacteriaceae bacterium]|nr:hypothetical protein [Acidobacteriaceae bacterium]